MGMVSLDKPNQKEVRNNEMKIPFKLALAAVAALCGVVALNVWAHSITAVTMSIGMPGQTVHLAGNPVGSVVNVTSQICPGDDLSFSVTLGADTQGQSTTFPMLGVPFTVHQTAGPGVVSLSPTSFNVDFNSATSTSPSTKNITMTAPATPGVYTVKVESPGKSTGSGQSQNKLNGGQLIINFTVSDCAQPCVPETTSISVDNHCVVLHQADTINLTATLLDSSNTGIVGQTLHFSVDGNAVGNAMTNSSGVAAIFNFNVSGLSVGDHEIVVQYDGVACPTDPSYEPSQSQGSIGVHYAAVYFQQPINADGSSIFKGGTIPAKIKVYDANGAIVNNAEAHVFFDYVTGNILGEAAEPLANTNGDSGNLMRYDPLAQQYIFNWDIRSAPNGTYRLYIDLSEGTCGDVHEVGLSMQKNRR